MTAIVIPEYGDVNHALVCLRSLREAGISNYFVIVVDHGTTHETGEMVRCEFPDTIVLTADSSLWWSGATNVGIRHAMTLGVEYVLLLNSDTVVTPLFLDRLTETAKQNPRHIVSSIVCFRDRPTIIRYAGGRIRWVTGNVVSTYYGMPESLLPKTAFQSDWAGGMGVLVPIELFRSVGLFDEKSFPHYAGDQDLWLRAKKEGFRLLVEPRSKIWVDDSHTGSKIRSIRNTWDFVKLLFDPKFHENIPTTLRFYFRHCPFYALPSGLLIHYLRNALRVFKAT